MTTTEPPRSSGFLAYAVPTITGEVLRHLRDRVSTVRVPRRVRGLRHAVYTADAELTAATGRTPRTRPVVLGGRVPGG